MVRNRLGPKAGTKIYGKPICEGKVTKAMKMKKMPKVALKSNLPVRNFKNVLPKKG
jgi:hypothetical protein